MVENRWEGFRKQAERALQLGHVKEIIFSGATYQVDIYDPETDHNYWSFLQFDEQGRIKDAFCSCPSDPGSCIHLASAYLSIVDHQGQPLHVRFEKSFWHHLCLLCAEHSSYEERILTKGEGDRYTYQNELFLELAAKNAEGRAELQKIMEHRPRETPENSIKFSTLPQEEITHWREGRPNRSLRYALSFWSDLAKWMMFHTQEGRVLFQEDSHEYPTKILLDFPTVSLYCEIKVSDLPRLIPYLDSVVSNLVLFPSDEEKIASITFDPLEKAFSIQHTTIEIEPEREKKEIDAMWVYISNLGFYPHQRQPMLHRSYIEKAEASRFLDDYTAHIAAFLPVHEKAHSLAYSMYFDEEWNWHFHAYLFEKGDLERVGACFFDHWVFLKGKGFFKIDAPLFDQVVVVLPAQQVSQFVNNNRIWLNSQSGFQTHLASVESHLIYTVSAQHTLAFFSKIESLLKEGGRDFADFGDWIFYKGQGFFSKRHARLGWLVYPGLEVKKENISPFIKGHREELESIPSFFTTTLPLASRGLSISVHSPTSILVKPLYTLLPGFNDSEIILFDDFVFIKGQGFCELPSEMRLPMEWVKERVVTHSYLAQFFESDLPILKEHIVQIDPALLTPHQTHLTVHSLVRVPGSGLSAELRYHTEWGSVALVDLLEAWEHKRRFCFTSAGLFDLQRESFQWLRPLKDRVTSGSLSIPLTTMEFIRLDTIENLLGPPAGEHYAAQTSALLNELRAFRAQETADTTGLQSELRLYQQTGLHWLWFLYRHTLSGLLCDDMGLGKTHQAMALIAAVLNHPGREHKKFLIVCPTSVIYHWEDKLAHFLPQLKVYTFHGLKRSLKRMPQQGILLTTYGVLRVEHKALAEIPFEIAIFDELQVAKNPSSRVHDALRKVNAQMRLGLTGTPIENNLRELKALFDIVLPGYMPTEARYREEFIQPIEKDQNPEKKALLNQLIKPFVLRRRKAEVLTELPEKSENKAYCELSPQQIALYQETLFLSQESLLSQLKDTDTPINYIHVFSLLSRLKQICDHPALLYKKPSQYKEYQSGKWELCMELLEEARQSDQKVVIFSQYLYMLDIFEHYLQEREWGYAQIRGDTINRRTELERFQHDPHCAIFIGSLQAAGLGIDLTAASVVILYDRWWNAARENQAIDRVHRMGQKWGVQVFKLITKETIEEKIDQMISRKGQLLEEIVTPDDQAVIKNFSRAELIELLSFQDHSTESVQ